MFGGNSESFTSYAAARSFWENRRKRKLAYNTWLENFGDAYAIRLHSILIVTFRPGRITLHSGGWRKQLTKERMNLFLPSGIWDHKRSEWVGFAASLWQNLGRWYLSVKDADGERATYHYEDGITLHENGWVTLDSGGAPAELADTEADARAYKRERAREVRRLKRERAWEVRRLKREGYVWQGKYSGWVLENPEIRAIREHSRATASAAAAELSRSERAAEIERRRENVLAEYNKNLPLYEPR